MVRGESAEIPRERRALFLPGLLQRGDLPAFAELDSQLQSGLGLETDVQDMVTGKLVPIEGDSNELVCDNSPADWLRDVVEFTYDQHPEADYVPVGFSHGGNLALSLAAVHRDDGYIFRGSGPVVGIAPSTIFLKRINLWDYRRDKSWSKNVQVLDGAERDEEPIFWRDFSFPTEPGVTYHATSRVLAGWLKPFTFLQYPRQVKVGRQLNRDSMPGSAFDGDLSDWAHLIKQDVLLVFGDRDTVAPPRNGEQLLEMLGSTASEMVVVPNAGHDDFWNKRAVYEEVFGEITEWVGRHLNRQSSFVHKTCPDEVLHVGVGMAPPRSPDVVVLAAARPLNRYGVSVIKAAAESGTQLAALCSHRADPADFVQSMMDVGASGVVVDFPETGWRPSMTNNLATPEHPVADNTSNLWIKRNIGLTLGGNRFFVDDDMVLSAAALTEAAGMLAYFKIVGFRPKSFPDLSVLGHADMLAGGSREVTYSGNSLAVGREAARESFFDPAYNEDRIFGLRFVKENTAAMLGDIEQAPYDPFDSSERARRQVFGDVLSDGLYDLLGGRMAYREADEDFWDYFIGYYGRQIDDVTERLTAILGNGDVRVPRARDSMRTMKTQLETYSPLDFASYVQALHQDTAERWPEAYDKLRAKLPEGSTLAEAVAYHGLSAHVVVVHKSTTRLVY